MELISGLFDRMVLQRGAGGRCDALIRGKADAAGEFFIRATKNRRPVAGLNWKKLLPVRRGGALEFRLRALPTGGPYEIQLQRRRAGRVVEKLVVRDVLVGDVWIAAGQSNMQGCGLLKFAAKPHPLVRAFYMNDRWAIAKDPIHNMWACVDQVHVDLHGGVRPPVSKINGTGPAVAFAQELFRRSGGVPQGILACAHGGTNMIQWNPSQRDDGGKSLYGALIRRFRKNGGKVAGMIWYQGESDALPEHAPKYTERMKKFIAALRRDTRSPRLPVVAVQIARVVRWDQPDSWKSIQEQQRRLPEKVAELAIVPGIDLRLDDTIHVGGPDMNRLGVRLAQSMHRLVGGAKAGKAPIAIRSVQVRPDRLSGLANIVVSFDNVQGRLRCANRPGGFTVAGSGAMPFIFDTELQGSRAILRTGLSATGLEGTSLYYGYGIDPMCNVVDEGDRSLPATGPLAILPRRALSPFVQSMRAAVVVGTAAGDLSGLKFPASLDGATWRRVDATMDFLNLHPELAKHAAQDPVAYFATRLTVAEPMRLAVHLGYDGPVKLWVDGKELLHDPSGTNPASADRARATFDATSGELDLLVALGSNQGRAWGILLRFERLDVPKSLVRKGPGHYAMPQVEIPAPD